MSRYNNFSNFDKDFGNSKDFDEYFGRMGRFFRKAFDVLRNNCYLVVISRDCYMNGSYILVSSKLAEIAKEEANLNLKGEIIWHQNGTRLRPYGYPFVFVPNIIHHNILVFRKEVKD